MSCPGPFLGATTAYFNQERIYKPIVKLLGRNLGFGFFFFFPLETDFFFFKFKVLLVLIYVCKILVLIAASV